MVNRGYWHIGKGFPFSALFWGFSAKISHGAGACFQSTPLQILHPLIFRRPAKHCETSHLSQAKRSQDRLYFYGG